MLKYLTLSLQRFVGVDAHIDPAECTVFTKIFGKFVTSQRADVGIGPYNHTEKTADPHYPFLTSTPFTEVYL